MWEWGAFYERHVGESSLLYDSGSLCQTRNFIREIVFKPDNFVTPVHLRCAILSYSVQVVCMANKDIIVIGASFGGVEALKMLVSGLPKGFHASVFLVQHRTSHAPSLLPEILMKAGPLPASSPADFEPIEQGHIYVAPPGYHMILERGLVRLMRGPKESRARPAIDALFRSAAYAYGLRVVGVVLTWLLKDGTAGLWAVKDRGGTAIVQDPEEAIAPSMPQSALQNVAVDYCLPLGEIAPLLAQLASTPTS